MPASAQNQTVDKGPPLDVALVKEFVGAAHGKFERTEEMLTSQPALLNATWDWGGGDFETGLGGASHMGNQEIARFLIGKGARMDVFAAAMLGELAIVQAMCKAFPNLHRSLGPHKIPLIAHARRGGPAAAEVVKYIEALGS
ncbi:MAG: ankyrin repeat domain-containing protein [Acidobacteriia bacterium]|nr:ankyrin repeat domain-containing protein [Terriglobia bacterium]